LQSNLKIQTLATGKVSTRIHISIDLHTNHICPKWQTKMI